MIEAKTCSKCKEFKLAKEFSRRGDGLRSHCKQCDKKYRNSKKESIRNLSWYDKLINWLF